MEEIRRHDTQMPLIRNPSPDCVTIENPTNGLLRFIKSVTNLAHVDINSPNHRLCYVFVLAAFVSFILNFPVSQVPKFPLRSNALTTWVAIALGALACNAAHKTRYARWWCICKQQKAAVARHRNPPRKPIGHCEGVRASFLRFLRLALIIAALESATVSSGFVGGLFAPMFVRQVRWVEDTATQRNRASNVGCH
uniref:Uncharacterized protein n=1 Tax=Anopheles culicifacies TaxID=139723 RepID=A0A182MTX7_9DIPT